MQENFSLLSSFFLLRFLALSLVSQIFLMLAASLFKFSLALSPARCLPKFVSVRSVTGSAQSSRLAALEGHGMYKIVARPKEFVTHLSLRDNAGARKMKKRLGRGLGGGRGKRSGRGQKGWKARGHGRAKPWRTYEGGQTPSLTERLPKWGSRRAKRLFKPFNLDKLKLWIDTGRIDATKEITVKELVDAKIVKNVKMGYGVKVLANGAAHFNHSIKLQVQQASKRAIEAIERVGGTIEVRYYDRISMLAKVRPDRFAFQPKFEIPKHKNDIAYYMDADRRGYLSGIAPLKPELLIPSLLARTKPTPGELQVRTPHKSAAGGAAAPPPHAV